MGPISVCKMCANFDTHTRKHSLERCEHSFSLLNCVCALVAGLFIIFVSISMQIDVDFVCTNKTPIEYPD